MPPFQFYYIEWNSVNFHWISETLTDSNLKCNECRWARNLPQQRWTLRGAFLQLWAYIWEKMCCREIGRLRTIFRTWPLPSWLPYGGLFARGSHWTRPRSPSRVGRTWKRKKEKENIAVVSNFEISLCQTDKAVFFMRVRSSRKGRRKGFLSYDVERLIWRADRKFSDTFWFFFALQVEYITCCVSPLSPRCGTQRGGRFFIKLTYFM